MRFVLIQSHHILTRFILTQSEGKLTRIVLTQRDRALTRFVLNQSKCRLTRFAVISNCKPTNKPSSGRFETSLCRYSFWPSNLHEVRCPPLQEDPYESKYVYAEKSAMSDYAGDGLFLKRDVSANTTIAFYNGIRVRPGDKAPYENTGYQIFVDWNKKSVSYKTNCAMQSQHVT